MRMARMRIPIALRSAMVTTAAMSRVHEQMKQGASQQEQVRQRAQRMGEVFGPQVKGDNARNRTSRKPIARRMAAGIGSVMAFPPFRYGISSLSISEEASNSVPRAILPRIKITEAESELT